MPYDENLARRVEKIVAAQFAGVPGLTHTGMFGGFGYLLNGNMCFGIHKDTLMIRVGVEAAEQLLAEPHVRPMDLTGKIMKGWATVEAEAMKSDKALARYCRLAVDFAATLPPKKEKAKAK